MTCIYLGAAFLAGGPRAVGGAAVPDDLGSDADSWRLRELHDDGRDGRLYHERHEEQEGEQAERAEQHERRGDVEQELLRGSLILLDLFIFCHDADGEPLPHRSAATCNRVRSVSPHVWEVCLSTSVGGCD